MPATKRGQFVIEFAVSLLFVIKQCHNPNTYIKYETGEPTVDFPPSQYPICMSLLASPTPPALSLNIGGPAISADSGPADFRICRFQIHEAGVHLDSPKPLHFLVPEEIHHVTPPLPSDAVVQWSAAFFHCSQLL